MLILLSGGAGNGKTTFARQLAAALPRPQLYVLTGRKDGAETPTDRLRRQTLQQAQPMETLRHCRELGRLELPRDSTVVVDCLCNLTANEMFAARGMTQAPHRKLLEDVEQLRRRCAHLILITNDITSGCGSYKDATPQYMRELSCLNRGLAQTADCVCELVCGIACVQKGVLPMQQVFAPTDSELRLVLGAPSGGHAAYAGTLGWQPQQISADPWADCPVLTDLQALHEPITPRLLRQLLTKRLILCREVGCGVIPVEQAAREARIRTGSLCVLLAQQARQVIRMICDVPMIIKG